MVAAIELVADKEYHTAIQPENSAPHCLAEECWDRGVYIRSSSMETVCVAPALCMEKKEIDRIVDTLDKAIPVMEKKLMTN